MTQYILLYHDYFDNRKWDSILSKIKNIEQFKQMALKCPTILIPLFKINDLHRPYIDELRINSNYNFIIKLLYLKAEKKEITQTLNAYLQDKYDEDLKAHDNCHAVAVWENFMRLFRD